MRPMSLNRLGGIALIVGPVMAIVFFLLQPGGVLIDMASPLCAIAGEEITPEAYEAYEACITAYTVDTALLGVTAILVPLGLVLTVYGFYAVQNVTRDGGGGDALSRLGFQLIVAAAFGWVLIQGLVPTYHAESAAILRTYAAYELEGDIALISDAAFSLGILTVSLALSTRDDFNRTAALVIAAVSVVALVSFIIPSSVSAQRDTMIMIGRICYFPWAIWAFIVGVRLVKMDAAEE